jgi:hypothetical protein
MTLFSDGMGNFEIQVPEGWKHDDDIAVVDGRYTQSFASRDGRCQFTVSVDAQVPERFEFKKYAKEELESPSSGIYAKMRKSTFHGMPAFCREYCYSSGATAFFGGGVMLFTGSIVFSLSWSAPESKHGQLMRVFDAMKASFRPRKGFTIRKAMPARLAGRDDA